MTALPPPRGGWRPPKQRSLRQRYRLWKVRNLPQTFGEWGCGLMILVGAIFCILLVVVTFLVLIRGILFLIP